MATETAAPTSQAAPAKAESGDGKKSSGITVGQATSMLLKREAALTKTPTSSENATKPGETQAEKAAPTEPVTDSKPVQAEKTEAKVEAAETKAEQAQAKVDEALSQEPSSDPKDQKNLEKRVAELVRERNLAEAEVARLKAQQLQAPPPPPAPTPDDPLAHVIDEQSWLKEQKTAKDLKRWAQDQLDRDDIDKGVESGGRVYTKQELRAVVRNVDDMLTEGLPARARFLQQRAQFTQKATETFPWMKEPGSPEFQKYQVLVRDPGIAKHANAPWIANLLVKGERDLEASIAEANKGTKPVSTREKAPASQTTTGAAPAPVREPQGTQAAKALQASLERLKGKRNVSVKDAARYLLQKDSNR